MSTAEMTPTKFLSRMAAVEAGHDGEPTQEIVTESSFFRRKEILDRVLGTLLLLPALPVIGLLVLIVRLNSRGPGVFRQSRVGKEGRTFTMYKLRSMRLDAEATTGPAWSPTSGDPRVTRLGYWLRRLHLDELPQLFNVARGEMSLVGPRPERPEFVEVLAEQLPGYLNRLMVQPGITGLAQINLPPDTDLDSVRRKLVLDCEYVRTACLGLDIRILACTALRMCWIKGPRVTRALGLERLVHLPAATPHTADHDAQPVAPVSLSSLADSAGPPDSRLNPAPANGSRVELPAGHAAGAAAARAVASPESSR
jgi:lipopolysaccharide/colanic/teichoic acid biosynthesis glycosyltransferase